MRQWLFVTKQQILHVFFYVFLWYNINRLAKITEKSEAAVLVLI